VCRSGFKTNDSRCETHIARLPQFEEPDRTTRPAPITVDHLGPRPPHRTYRRYPCRPIDRAASARIPTKPLTLPHLPPTLLTSRYHVHRSPSQEPLGTIGLRVGIGTISMNIVTVAVQDVIDYDLSLPGRSSPYPTKVTPPRIQNLRSVNIHARLFCFAIFIAARTVTRIRALVRVNTSLSLKVK